MTSRNYFWFIVDQFYDNDDYKVYEFTEIFFFVNENIESFALNHETFWWIAPKKTNKQNFPITKKRQLISLIINLLQNVFFPFISFLLWKQNKQKKLTTKKKWPP